MIEETDIGHRSTCKYFDVPVIWVEDIRLLPHGKNNNLHYIDYQIELSRMDYRGRKNSIHFRTRILRRSSNSRL